MSTGRSIHAMPSITPSPREGIEDGPRLRADPLGLSNWQMTQKTAFDVGNKTGSEVHIAASTMVGRCPKPGIQRRSRAGRRPSQLSQPVQRDVRQTDVARWCFTLNCNRLVAGLTIIAIPSPLRYHA